MYELLTGTPRTQKRSAAPAVYLVDNRKNNMRISAVNQCLECVVKWEISISPRLSFLSNLVTLHVARLPNSVKCSTDREGGYGARKQMSMHGAPIQVEVADWLAYCRPEKSREKKTKKNSARAGDKRAISLLGYVPTAKSVIATDTRGVVIRFFSSVAGFVPALGVLPVGCPFYLRSIYLPYYLPFLLWTER